MLSGPIVLIVTVTICFAKNNFAVLHAVSLKIWGIFFIIYSAGEKKSSYFLFQGETANFTEKFQGEIAEFLRENMELYRQNLKNSGRNTDICWRKYWISWRNFPLFLPVSPRKKGS